LKAKAGVKWQGKTWALVSFNAKSTNDFLKTKNSKNRKNKKKDNHKLRIS